MNALQIIVALVVGGSVAVVLWNFVRERFGRQPDRSDEIAAATFIAAAGHDLSAPADFHAAGHDAGAGGGDGF